MQNPKKIDEVLWNESTQKNYCVFLPQINIGWEKKCVYNNCIQSKHYQKIVYLEEFLIGSEKYQPISTFKYIECL